jgi:hypothetical protein
MDLKQNKFLATYLAVLLIGVLALGWFAFSRYRGYSDAVANVQTLRDEVGGLEKRSPFPDEGNVKARTAQADELKKTVDALQGSLLKFQPPLDLTIEPDKFQTKLAGLIDQVKAQAQASNIKIADGFNLGMDRYLQGPPPAAAVAELNYQLEGIHTFVKMLLDARVAEIGSITRDELPIEKADAAAPATPAANAKAPVKGAKPAVTAAGPVVPESDALLRYPFLVRFAGTGRAIEDVLNQITTTAEGSPFFNLRLIRVENAKKSSPSKGSLPEADASSTETPRDAVTVLGGEHVHVAATLDLIRFVDPAKVAAAPATPAPADK